MLDELEDKRSHLELFLESVSILSRLDLLGSGFSLPSGGSRVNKVSISSADVRLEVPEKNGRKYSVTNVSYCSITENARPKTDL